MECKLPLFFYLKNFVSVRWKIWLFSHNNAYIKMYRKKPRSLRDQIFLSEVPMARIHTLFSMKIIS